MSSRRDTFQGLDTPRVERKVLPPPVHSSAEGIAEAGASLTSGPPRSRGGTGGQAGVYRMVHHLFPRRDPCDLSLDVVSVSSTPRPPPPSLARVESLRAPVDMPSAPLTAPGSRKGCRGAGVANHGLLACRPETPASEPPLDRIGGPIGANRTRPDRDEAPYKGDPSLPPSNPGR